VLEVVDRLDAACAPLALKLVDGTDAVTRARQEFLLLATLEHPTLARVYDFGLCPESGGAFFTQELIGGDTLGALAQARALPAAALGRVALALADVLAYLHERSVLHLDLKPANVLLERQGGRVRLVDLGVARVTHAGHHGAIGTPGYVAPEVIAGGPNSKASDVFALGATLYAASEGRVPFAPSRSGSRPGRVEDGLAWSGDRALGKLVASMIARDPELRPTAHQIRAGLAATQPGELRLPRPSFSGRAHDLAALVEAVERGGALIALEGEPGVGKSRLLRALKQTLEARGRLIAVLEASTGEAWPVLRALLSSLSGTPPPADPSALGELRRGVDLVLIDRADQLGERDVALLEASFAAGSGAPLLLAAPPGAGPIERLAGRMPAERFRLGPLDTEGVETCLRSVLGKSPTRALVERVLGQTHGYPRALRAFLDHAEYVGIVRLEDDGWSMELAAAGT
jgi:hypothetical protein